MKRILLPALATACVFVAPIAVALPWNQDMVDQPSVKPQESLVREPAGSVPAGGGEIVAKPADLAQLVMQRVQAATIPNPQAVSTDSVARGRETYAVHCGVCHGAGGKGDGLVGQKFSPPPMDLTNAYVQQQADGQLFFTITHGSVVMPFYRDAIPVKLRWDVVNYIKNGLASQ